MKKYLKKFLHIFLTLTIMSAFLLVGVPSALAEGEKTYTEYPFTSSVSLNSPHNVVWNSWAGMRITIGSEPLSVTALGRIFSSGTQKTHYMMIVKMDGSIVISGIKVDGTNVEADKFGYTTLQTPISLEANTSYYIVTDFGPEPDVWYDGSVSTHNGVASIDGLVLLNGTSNAWEYYAAPNTGWGPVDFKYQVENPTQPNPSSTTEASGENTTNSTDTTTTTTTTTTTSVITTSTVTISQKNMVEKAFAKKVTLNGPRNTNGDKNPVAAGWGGMKITVGKKDIMVTALGRIHTSESAANHNFMVVNAEDNSLLVSGITSTATEKDKDGSFVYAKLKDAVTLKAGKSYYIVVDFQSANDKWYDAAIVEHDATIASLDGIVVLDIEKNSWNFFTAENTGWGPLDFKYLTEETVPATGDNASSFVAALFAFGAIACLTTCRKKK